MNKDLKKILASIGAVGLISSGGLTLPGLHQEAAEDQAKAPGALM